MKTYRFLMIFVLAILLLGCTPQEQGEIYFVSPVSGTKFHNPSLDNGVEVTINSTFNEAKSATITTIWGAVTCELQPMTNTPCGAVPIQVGENSLQAQVFKKDGTVVTTDTVYYWQPYSAVDQFMGMIATSLGGEAATPSMAYGILALIIIVVGSFAFLGSGGKYGILAVFFVPLIGLAIYSQQTGSVVVTLTIIRLFSGLITGIIILLLVRNYQNKIHYLHIKKDGVGSITYRGSGGKRGAAVVEPIVRHAGKILEKPREQPFLPSPYGQGQYLPPYASPLSLPSGEDYIDATVEYPEPVEREVITPEISQAEGIGGLISRALRRNRRR